MTDNNIIPLNKPEAKDQAAMLVFYDFPADCGNLYEPPIR
ncbi:hypothetical protein MNBD_GAMMA16-312 [hydrothermal vent metagenome]|uniref:Uncharacterized protein n=1 Tax=hydrothermal vent metagenome TaxID=652676 RepID=A0A3B0YVN8_9ZZZZ